MDINNNKIMNINKVDIDKKEPKKNNSAGNVGDFSDIAFLENLIESKLKESPVKKIFFFLNAIEHMAHLTLVGFAAATLYVTHNYSIVIIPSVRLNESIAGFLNEYSSVILSVFFLEFLLIALFFGKKPSVYLPGLLIIFIAFPILKVPEYIHYLSKFSPDTLVDLFLFRIDINYPMEDLKKLVIKLIEEDPILYKLNYKVSDLKLEEFCYKYKTVWEIRTKFESLASIESVAGKLLYLRNSDMFDFPLTSNPKINSALDALFPLAEYIVNFAVRAYIESLVKNFFAHTAVEHIGKLVRYIQHHRLGLFWKFYFTGETSILYSDEALADARKAAAESMKALKKAKAIADQTMQNVKQIEELADMTDKLEEARAGVQEGSVSQEDLQKMIKETAARMKKIVGFVDSDSERFEEPVPSTSAEAKKSVTTTEEHTHNTAIEIGKLDSCTSAEGGESSPKVKKAG